MAYINKVVVPSKDPSLVVSEGIATYEEEGFLEVVRPNSLSKSALIIYPRVESGLILSGSAGTAGASITINSNSLKGYNFLLLCIKEIPGSFVLGYSANRCPTTACSGVVFPLDFIGSADAQVFCLGSVVQSYSNLRYSSPTTVYDDRWFDIFLESANVNGTTYDIKLTFNDSVDSYKIYGMV